MHQFSDEQLHKDCEPPQNASIPLLACSGHTEQSQISWCRPSGLEQQRLRPPTHPTLSHRSHAEPSILWREKKEPLILSTNTSNLLFLGSIKVTIWLIWSPKSDPNMFGNITAPCNKKELQISTQRTTKKNNMNNFPDGNEHSHCQCHIQLCKSCTSFSACWEPRQILNHGYRSKDLWYIHKQKSAVNNGRCKTIWYQTWNTVYTDQLERGRPTSFECCDQTFLGYQKRRYKNRWEK